MSTPGFHTCSVWAYILYTPSTDTTNVSTGGLRSRVGSCLPIGMCWAVQRQFGFTKSVCLAFFLISSSASHPAKAHLLCEGLNPDLASGRLLLFSLHSVCVSPCVCLCVCLCVCSVCLSLCVVAPGLAGPMTGRPPAGGGEPLTLPRPAQLLASVSTCAVTSLGASGVGQI